MADEQQQPQQWYLKLDPRSVNCELRLNGESLRHVRRVRVDADVDSVPTLELTLVLPDLVIEGVPGQIIIEREVERKSIDEANEARLTRESRNTHDGTEVERPPA